MINYWQQWNDRERIMVVAAVLCALIYAFYLLIYSPLTTAVNNKTKQLAEKTDTLLWMKEAAKQRHPQQAPETTSNSKLLVIITSQLGEQLKHFPYQLQQTAGGDIQLSFEQIPYAAAMQWLWTLNQHYKISLKQMRMDKTDTAGVIKWSVVIAAN